MTLIKKLRLWWRLAHAMTPQERTRVRRSEAQKGKRKRKVGPKYTQDELEAAKQRADKLHARLNIED